MTKTEDMAVPEIVERVARAIAAGLGYEWSTLYANKSEWTADRGSRHDINVPYKPDFVEAARAAIEAMMEPSDEMVEAFYGSVVMTREGSAVGFALGWRAALRASLQSKGEKP